jgi:hypothetical protein
MAPTNCVQKDVRKAPGCSNKAAWSHNTTMTDNVSSLLRKECEYQKKLNVLPIEEQKNYPPTFVHWAHLSCAFWLPQIKFPKNKPI